MKKYNFTDEMITFLIKNKDMNRAELQKEFNHKFDTDFSQCSIRQELYKHTDYRLQKEHSYTDEQENFIRENAEIFSRKELLNKFNERFNTKITYCAITQKIYKLGLDKKIEHITDEQTEFILENFMHMNWESLCDLFNKTYGTSFNAKSLNRIAYERGFKKYERNHFTKEQRQFLIENIEKYSYPKLTEEFNNKFNKRCTQGAITQQCMAYLKIKKGDSYIPHNAMDLGAEVVKCKVRGYETTYVKIKCGLKDNKSEMWKPKHQIIWEEHNRPIAEDEIVVFLDGDKTNFELDNLYCIPKKIMCVMNLNSWFTKSKKHTLTAIKWCELFYAMKSEME